LTSINLEIDGQEVKAEKGITILEAAKSVGIKIPTLCYHKNLAPYGACRMCVVEIIKEGRSHIVASCGYPVEDNLKVKTRSPRIDKIRKTIIELFLPLVSDSDVEIKKTIRRLMDEYGADASRFMSKVKVTPTRCILCGQCVRYCSEVAKVNAIGFVGRGIERRVVFFPEIASQFCSSCQRCFHICPTGKILAETDGIDFSGFSLEDYFAKRI
jgi:bidirectional [NiFe] hydrogenase diaphorase subunit